MECAPAKNLEPVIDRSRCEGKADCVTACPEQVFDIRVVSLEERELLPFVARMIRLTGTELGPRCTSRVCSG